ncbi:hypothetical protein PAEPH01_1703, partial [Pancytospora epiphaga]
HNSVQYLNLTYLFRSKYDLINYGSLEGSGKLLPKHLTGINALCWYLSYTGAHLCSCLFCYLYGSYTSSNRSLHGYDRGVSPEFVMLFELEVFSASAFSFRVR